MKSGKLCPSYTATKGAFMLGVVNEQGQLEFLETPIPITKGFIDEGKKGRSLESRFRFTNKCIESGCKQWNGRQCGVIESAMGLIETPNSNIQNCAIRKDCRWYHQRGLEACKTCPLVITDVKIDNLLF